MTNTLEELEALEAKATAGEWLGQEAVGGTFGQVKPNLLRVTPTVFDGGGTPCFKRAEDADFIAAFRNNAKDLIAKARKLEAMEKGIAEAHEAIDAAARYCEEQGWTDGIGTPHTEMELCAKLGAAWMTTQALRGT